MVAEGSAASAVLGEEVKAGTPASAEVQGTVAARVVAAGMVVAVRVVVEATEVAATVGVGVRTEEPTAVAGTAGAMVAAMGMVVAVRAVAKARVGAETVAAAVRAEEPMAVVEAWAAAVRAEVAEGGPVEQAAEEAIVVVGRVGVGGMVWAGLMYPTSRPLQIAPTPMTQAASRARSHHSCREDYCLASL